MRKLSWAGTAMQTGTQLRSGRLTLNVAYACLVDLSVLGEQYQVPDRAKENGQVKLMS